MVPAINEGAFFALFGLELAALASVWGLAYAIKIAKQG